MKQVISVACAVLLAACAAAAGIGDAGKATDVTKGNVPAHRTGRCHCGAVAYTVRGAIVKCTYCDCRACQRASGALKTPYVTVLRASFKVMTGKPATFRSSAKVKCDMYGVWRFCRKCGGPLFWESDNCKELDVFAATFDDPSVFRPTE